MTMPERFLCIVWHDAHCTASIEVKRSLQDAVSWAEGVEAVRDVALSPDIGHKVIAMHLGESWQHAPSWTHDAIRSHIAKYGEPQ